LLSDEMHQGRRTSMRGDDIRTSILVQICYGYIAGTHIDLELAPQRESTVPGTQRHDQRAVGQEQQVELPVPAHVTQLLRSEVVHSQLRQQPVSESAVAVSSLD